ncbi:MAG TPA: hypothetical protein VNO21_04410 [Polyangiaceae bacterium]|nr:hypothetical protein [Polyangiaceae bacterium]
MSTGAPTAPDPTTLFRAMRRNEGGKPLCGSAGSLLGVRAGIDITPDASGRVTRGHGGLSVTPNDPQKLPPHVRPPQFGGKGKLPIFQIRTSAIGLSLCYRADPGRPQQHGFIEPREPMLLNDYQSALGATQSEWKELA